MPPSFNYTIFLSLLLSTSPSFIWFYCHHFYLFIAISSLFLSLLPFYCPQVQSTSWMPHQQYVMQPTVCSSTSFIIIFHVLCQLSSGFIFPISGHFSTPFFHTTFLSVKHESLFTLHGFLSLLIPNQSFSSHNCLKSIMRMSVKWNVIALQFNHPWNYDYRALSQAETVSHLCLISQHCCFNLISVWNSLVTVHTIVQWLQVIKDMRQAVHKVLHLWGTFRSDKEKCFVPPSDSCSAESASQYPR